MPPAALPPALPPEERLHFEGPAGRLEGRWRPAPLAESPPRRAALLCHPHPLFGGSLANKVLYRLAKALSSELSIPSLRFNYRGVGESEGAHDDGRGEIQDTTAALAELHRRARQIPHLAIGYSFGAAVGLKAAARENQVEALVALGLPVRREWSLDYLLRASAPLLVVQAEDDEFGDPAAVRKFLAPRLAPSEVAVIADTSHLFPKHEDAAVAAVVSYLRSLDSTPPE